MLAIPLTTVVATAIVHIVFSLFQELAAVMLILTAKHATLTRTVLTLAPITSAVATPPVVTQLAMLETFVPMQSPLSALMLKH